MAEENERALALDIELCDLGLAMTRGKLRKRYADHRRACFRAIFDLNKRDGLDKMTDDELYKALKG